MPIARTSTKSRASWASLSEKARAGKLSPNDMQGGCFTISSLGGIGGTAFTPIINAPEVAILGVSRSAMRPVFRDGTFVPRLILPLSLSYDHRVIDGATAARFTTFLAQTLARCARPHRGCAVSRVDLIVPDIGNAHDVIVVDVLVKNGDVVEVDTPLVTLETDKASMDVPRPSAGTVAEVLLKRGDKVSEGSVIARVETNSQAGARQAPARAARQWLPQATAEVRRSLRARRQLRRCKTSPEATRSPESFDAESWSGRLRSRCSRSRQCRRRRG